MKKIEFSLSLSLLFYSPYLRDVDRVRPQRRVIERVRLEAAGEGLGDGLEREREQLEDKGRHRDEVFVFAAATSRASDSDFSSSRFRGSPLLLLSFFLPIALRN